MRLLEFQPQDQLHDLEAFFEEHPDLRLKVQVIFNQLGKKNHNMARSIVANPGKHYAGLPIYLVLACLPIVCLFAIPFEPVGAITLLVISVVFNIVFRVCAIGPIKSVWTMLAIWSASLLRQNA